jgi:hypothetical protein
MRIEPEPEPLNHQIDSKILKPMPRNLHFFILEIKDFSIYVKYCFL